jgi:signal transduction histidine kinase
VGQHGHASGRAGTGQGQRCPEFTVTDDGAGFDTATTRHGTGLQGMADRLAALGGALHVRSQPGHGTILSGELPLPHLVTD